MNALDTLRARWAALAPRERQLVSIAAALVGIALLWWVALAPALRTLSVARTEHAKLDAQLQQMTTLQAQAKSLQGQTRIDRNDAVRALESSVRGGLGPTAQMQQSGAGEGANISMRGVSADALAQWLAQARGNARALPREAHLTRSTDAAAKGGATAATADDTNKIRWDGTLVMSLPSAR